VRRLIAAFIFRLSRPTKTASHGEIDEMQSGDESPLFKELVAAYDPSPIVEGLATFARVPPPRAMIYYQANKEKRRAATGPPSEKCVGRFHVTTKEPGLSW
jgi:hypothetical protein